MEVCTEASSWNTSLCLTVQDMTNIYEENIGLRSRKGFIELCLVGSKHSSFFCQNYPEFCREMDGNCISSNESLDSVERRHKSIGEWLNYNIVQKKKML